MPLLDLMTGTCAHAQHGVDDSNRFNFYRIDVVQVVVIAIHTSIARSALGATHTHTHTHTHTSEEDLHHPVWTHAAPEVLNDRVPCHSEMYSWAC